MSLQFVNLKLIRPWEGYREPLFYCPICKAYFSGPNVSHPKFGCDWLGAKVQFEHYGQIVTGEVCEIDYIYETIVIEIESDSIYATKVFGDIKDFPKLKVLEKPLSKKAKHDGEKRGRANRWTYSQ